MLTGAGCPPIPAPIPCLPPALLSLSGCGCMSVPSHDELRATALRLEFQDGCAAGRPSGLISLLTAVHCMAQPLVRVNGYPVTGCRLALKESRDRIVVKVSGIGSRRGAKRGSLRCRRRSGFGGSRSRRTVRVPRSHRIARQVRIRLCCRQSVLGTQVPDWLIDAQGRVVGVMSRGDGRQGLQVLGWSL